MFTRMSTRDRLVKNIEISEQRVIDLLVKDAVHYDKDLDRVQKRADKRLKKIERYEKYAAAARQALVQYDLIAAQMEAKKHANVQHMPTAAQAV